MIRPMTEKDARSLKQLEQGFEWTFDADFMDGLVFTDENDRPVMAVGAWSRAEVHMLTDKGWGTPGMRLAAMETLHGQMEQRLRDKHVGQAITWIDGMKALGRRLKNLGWVKSSRTSWHRGI